MSPSWPNNHSNKSGQYTNCSVMINKCNTTTTASTSKCPYCNKIYKQTNHFTRCKKHVQAEHVRKEKVQDISMEEAKQSMVDYFKNNFNVRLDPGEFDKLVEERRKEHEKQKTRNANNQAD